MIKILLVDDHELVRKGMETLLNAEADISVVGVARSGEEGVKQVKELNPDVILMDINMPGMGGSEACRRILQRNSDVKIVVVSMHNDGPIPKQLMKLGVMGFVSKDSSIDEVLIAVRRVMEGSRYLCSQVANNMAFQALPGNEESPFSKLSQRETEVVGLILQGKTIKEMSDLLVISDKTVNTYRYRLYDKLQVKNDVELTRLAVKFDYIDIALI